MNSISIKGLNKAAVLAALYNHAKPLGMGFLHFTPEPMTLEEAGQLLKKGMRFDYLKGRVMKIDLDKDEMRTDFYDRDNGNGQAIFALKEAGLVN